MSKLTFLYLSEPDVIETGLSLSETVELCTESLRQHGLKEIENPPKNAIHPMDKSFLHGMPAWLKQKGICGVKWVSGFSGNVKEKLPTIVGLITLNSTETGFPVAVMDGTYITAIRTAGVSGVAVQHLARRDSEVLCIVGTGVQGKYHTLSITKQLPGIKKIRYFDGWAPSLAAYKEQVEPLLPNITFEVASSVEDAVRGADVVVGCTGVLSEKLYSFEWVKEGALVLPVHLGGWESDIMSKFDKCVADDWYQIKTNNKFYKTDFKTPPPELGEIVCGTKPGRENDKEKIISVNYGLAIHDMICANNVLEKAKAKGLGVTLELMDLGSPIPLPPI